MGETARIFWSAFQIEAILILFARMEKGRVYEGLESIAYLEVRIQLVEGGYLMCFCRL